MGWYYNYRPYVSVAQRRQKAQRELDKRRKRGLAVSPVVLSGRKIAQTFWGKAWCDNLESYSDFANRLPRGRTYVRNGSVVHLEIGPGTIAAVVSGSELYTVEIKIVPLTTPHWKSLRSECAGQIGSLVELLQGRLSKSVMEVVTRHDRGLFPKPAEIEMKCSCPDWAGMCKHVAAVMYGIGARLDQQPELLFVLRKVDHVELISGAMDAAPATDRGKASAEKSIAASDLADVFGIELTDVDAEGNSKQALPQEAPKPKASRRKPAVQAAAQAAANSKQATAATRAKSGKAKPVKKRSQASSRTRKKAAKALSC
jgi:uncharacterized Zn finger protein